MQSLALPDEDSNRDEDNSEQSIQIIADLSEILPTSLGQSH